MPDHIKKKIQEAKANKDSSSGKSQSSINKFAGLAIADTGSGTSNLPHFPEHSADLSSQTPHSRVTDGGEVQGGVGNGKAYHEVGGTEAFVAMAAGAIQDRDTWVVDSGCNVHIVNDRKWFTTFTTSHQKSVGTADGQVSLSVEGTGEVVIECTSSDNENHKILLEDVFYAPMGRCNLLSVSKLLADGSLSIEADDAGMTLRKDGHGIGCAPTVRRLYHLRASVPQSKLGTEPVAAFVDFEHPVWKWYRRLGHLSLGNMRNLLKISDGIDLTDEQIKKVLQQVCPVCATTRALTHIPRDPAKRRAREPGQFIHVDTWGKYPITGWDGTHYFLFLTDDATRFTWSARYSRKRDLPEVFKSLYTTIETSLNIKIRNCRFDGEFDPGPIARWLERKGVALETTEPYRHYQNGPAERSNRTVRERSAAMIQEDNVIRRIHDITVGRTEEILRQAKRPEKLWPEAVEHAVWLKNRSPARALRRGDKKTPWHALHDEQPSLDREKVWGSRCYMTFPPEISVRQPKLHSPRGWIGYWVGRHSESVDKVYSPEKRKVFKVGVSRVEDGQGLDDPQPKPTYADRVEIPEVEIPDHMESDEESESESESDVDGSDSDGDEADDNDDPTRGSGPAEMGVFAGLALKDDDYMSEGSDTEPETPALATDTAPTTGFVYPVQGCYRATGPPYFPNNSRVRQHVERKHPEFDYKAYKESIKKPKKAPTPRYVQTPAGLFLLPFSTLRPEPAKCNAYFLGRGNCDRNTARGEKCTRCQKSGRRYIDQTKESLDLIPAENRVPAIAPAAQLPDERCRRYYTKGYICVFDDDTGTCRQCKKRKYRCNMDLTGAKSRKEQTKKSSNPTVPTMPKPPEGGCARYSRKNLRYDGETLCNHCKGHPRLEKWCSKNLPLGGTETRLRCANCLSQRLFCDRGTPCSTCTGLGISCKYHYDGGLTATVYPSSKSRKSKPVTDKDLDVEYAYNRCRAGWGHAAAYDQGRPCYNCANSYLGITGELKTCLYTRADGTINQYQYAPYTKGRDGGVTLKDDWEMHIPRYTEIASTLESQQREVLGNDPRIVGDGRTLAH